VIKTTDIAWAAGLIEGEGSFAMACRTPSVAVMPSPRTRGRKPTWIAQAKGSVAAGVIMTLYAWLGIRRREQARTALAAWRRQGHGVVAGPIADAIVEYRKAGYSQADIMELFRVGKSTVYRHTKDHVRRMHVTTRRPILPMTMPPTP
jgi:hypothetical protein